jgi:hypothetical protein
MKKATWKTEVYIGGWDENGSQRDWLGGGGSVEWTQPAQDRDRWRAVVNAVMNLLVLPSRSKSVGARRLRSSTVTFTNLGNSHSYLTMLRQWLGLSSSEWDLGSLIINYELQKARKQAWKRESEWTVPFPRLQNEI